MIRLQEVVTAYAGDLSADMNGQQVTVAGMVQRVRRHVTKKGDEMAFVTLEDLQGTCDVVVFPRVWKGTKNLWQPERIVVMSGKVDAGRRDTPSLLCNWVKTPDAMSMPADNGEQEAVDGGQRKPLLPRTRPTPSPACTIRVTLTRSGQQSQDVQKLREVHGLLVGHSGQDRFVIHLAGGASRQVELTFPNDTTRYSSDLARKLAAIVGAGAVHVEGQ
jgi:DNA polymerase-3 subunit alpha